MITDTDVEMLAVGLRCRAARLRAGMSQVEVADAMSLTQAAVSGWECGVRDPTLSRFLLFARVVGATAGELAGESPMKPKKRRNNR